MLGLLAACEGEIDGLPGTLPPPPPPMGGGGTTGTGGGAAGGTPARCEPGAHQVTKLLRLSNHEYQAMASDVLGVALDPALFTRWTPVAQVYGFDTMSETRIDAQGLEVQLETAERLADLVLATPALTSHCPAVRPAQTPACNLKTTYSALDDFSDAQARECWSYLDSTGTPMAFDNANARWRKMPDETAYLWRSGAHPGPTVDVVRRWVAPMDGTVTISGSFADADTGGGDGVLVTIRRAGATLFTRDLPNGGSTTYSLPLTVARGDQFDFVVNRKANASWDTTAFTASIPFRATPRKDAWTWANCAQPLVSRLASRSFRRPVRADELADYEALFASNLRDATAAGFTEPVDEAMKAVLQALFLSPNFVFKPELVPNGLDPQERAFGVASRLGLFFRGSIADEQLWQLAGTRQLDTPEQVRAQANRLLDQDLERFTTSFGGQWLDFREANGIGPLAAQMQRESKEMFSTVLRDGLPPERLLRPGFTLAEAPLASLYNLSNGTGQGPVFRYTTTQRGGLLAQAAFLTRTANGSEFRRPIHRGLWVVTRVLCRSLPHLDQATLEEIGNSFNTIDRTKPLPEQMAAHRNTNTRCGGCHSQIDPIGLALEKYDAQGLWRETYANGAPIVTSLELDGVTVRDPHELALAVEASPDFRTCVATKLLTFGLNRGPLEDERCIAEKLARPPGPRPTLKAMTVEALMQSMELTKVTP